MPEIPAGFGRRSLAFFVDIFALLLIDVIFGALTVILELTTGFTLSNKLFVGGLAGVDSLYFILLWWAGKTIGHSAVNIRLVGRNGGRLSLGRVILRFVAFWIALAPAGLGLLWAAFGPKRGWHDLVAGSELVVQEHMAARGLADKEASRQKDEPETTLDAPLDRVPEIVKETRDVLQGETVGEMKPAGKATGNPFGVSARTAVSEPESIQLDLSGKRAYAYDSGQEAETVELDIPEAPFLESRTASKDADEADSAAAGRRQLFGRSSRKTPGGRSKTPDGKSSAKSFMSGNLGARTGKSSNELPPPSTGPVPGTVVRRPPDSQN
ncbi:MAG: RDD family protein [Chloroflexi bacterium]|nr:RDD family protein [Chloroflexota bacterium]